MPVLRPPGKRRRRHRPKKTKHIGRPLGNPNLKAQTWDNPEWVKRFYAGVADGTWTRMGVPDGMNKYQAKKYWARVLRKVDRLMDEMQKNDIMTFDLDIPEEEMARQAMREVLRICLGAKGETSRIAASRIVLEYTKAKPASKQDLTLKGADAWLAAAIKDHKETSGS